MATVFNKGWNTEKGKYAEKYGNYRGCLDCFDEGSILKALCESKGHFNGQWVQGFLTIACNPHNAEKVTVEQVTRQAEGIVGGGLCLHFTGRDNYGFVFHFYVVREHSGKLKIFEISYFNNSLTSFKRIN